MDQAIDIDSLAIFVGPQQPMKTFQRRTLFILKHLFHIFINSLAYLLWFLSQSFSLSLVSRFFKFKFLVGKDFDQKI